MIATFLKKNPSLKRFFAIFLLTSFLNHPLYAALYGYCFSRGTSLSSAQAYLDSVKAPRDRTYLRESVSCLEVKGSPARFDLYYKFLSKKFRVLRTYKDQDTGSARSSDLSTGMCRIFVTKIGKKDSKTDKVLIGNRGKVKREEFSGNSKSVSNLILSYGKRGSLSVNSQRIGVTCKKSGSGYQLSFDLESANSAISSNAFISSGQDLNIGGIVNDLNNKRRALSLEKGVEYEKQKGSEKFDYFLKIK